MKGRFDCWVTASLISLSDSCPVVGEMRKNVLSEIWSGRMDAWKDGKFVAQLCKD
jgi:hypothetical protein